MARLLVRNATRAQVAGGDMRRSASRGDVLSIVDDGHVFSEREETNPDWVILESPGDDAQVYLDMELTHVLEPDEDHGYVWFRKVYIDLTDMFDTYGPSPTVNPAQVLAVLKTRLPTEPWVAP